jgi:UDP-glucose 4-epimerase
MHQIQQSRPLRIDGDGTQERDFVHVEDVVAANIFCMDYQKRFNGEAYDIGTGFSTSLNDIKKIIDAHHCVSWDHSPGRSGDIRLSCANTIPLKDLGWAAKISSISGITECFI